MTKEEEIAKLALSQLRDMKAQQIINKGDSPPYWAKEGAEEAAGVKYKDVQPSRVGEKNPTGFPAKDPNTLYDSEGEVIGFGADKTMTNWSQQAGDPMKARGGPPAQEAEMGALLEQSGIYANKLAKTWKSGKFDPEAFNKAVAQSKKEMKPEIWVLEEDTGKVVIATRKEDGSIVVGGKRKGAPPKKTVVVNGKEVFNPKIDLVVDTDAQGKLTKAIGAIERRPLEPMIDDFNNYIDQARKGMNLPSPEPPPKATPPKRETLTLKKK
jgi:hypothetical protein